MQRTHNTLQVPIGKFGLADDFSFAEHNETSTLCALDNTVPNCYCNVALIMLYLLPWLRVHCLSSLMRSQFILSDELGFLFHMMDCAQVRQPRLTTCKRVVVHAPLTLGSLPLT